MLFINKEAQYRAISVFVLILVTSFFVIATNQSLNETNNSLQDGILNITPDVNLSINVSVEINVTDISVDIINISENGSVEGDITDNLGDITNESNITIKPTLATVVNGKSIFDDSYTEIYLSHYTNLSYVDFKNLTQRGSSALLKAGNVETKIEGFVLNNKKYAVHLIACNREKGTCNFRVNGVLAKRLSPDGTNTFDLDENYMIKIKSIIIDFCDNRLVCDYLLQSYDLVEIEVVKR